jgi:hypothetical protein
MMMVQDTYTEVTTQSWFSRIKDSFAGVLVGLLIFAISFFLLWSNEGRAVQTADALREVQKTVIALPSAEVSAQNEGKLIYVNGTAKTAEVLTDASLGVSANAIKLLREVEMYQWVESSQSKTQEKFGGGKETVTTYTYETKWSGTPKDSGEFKKPEGHTNPAMQYSDTTIAAKKVPLGQFELSPGLIDKISTTEPLAFEEADLAKLPAQVRSKSMLNGEFLYIGRQAKPDPDSPQVGDYRINYRIVPVGTSLSVISKQIANTFEPYRSKNGQLTELLETGTVSADAMVKTAQQNNQFLTWLLRLLGFILMFVGLALSFKPLSIIGAVIPILGQIIGAGTGLVAFLISLALSLITIAIAWFAYRPVLAIGLILVAVLAVFLANRKSKSGNSGIVAK